MAVRTFWMAVGAGAGVWAARKVKQKTYKYTPEGVADNVTGLGEALKYLAGEVRAGMAEREREIYRAVGADVLAAAPRPTRDAIRGSAGRAALPAQYEPTQYEPTDPYDEYDRHPYDDRYDLHRRYDRRDGR